MIFLKKKKPDLIPLFDIERQKMQYYWNKYIEVSNNVDKYIYRTDEVNKLIKLRDDFLNKYLELHNKGYSEFKYKRVNHEH